MTAIDVHAHLCPEDLPDFADEFGSARWPVLRSTGETSAVIMRDGSPYRQIDDRYWGLDRRLDYLDGFGIDRQVVSPLPVLLPHWAPPAEAAQVCRWQNRAVAKYVARKPDRLIGFGTVSLQDSEAATSGLEQIVELGLAGVEIGTTYTGAELVSPEFRPFFHAAAALNLPVLVHPLEGAGLGRMTDKVVRYSVGVLTDTSIAATTLTLGGVLGEIPTLRMCLSHGGGGFFWGLPRLRAMMSADREAELEAAAARFWVDTASLGPENLAFLADFPGRERMLIGSDFPAMAEIDPLAAVAKAGWNDELPHFVRNAERFLGQVT